MRHKSFEQVKKELKLSRSTLLRISRELNVPKYAGEMEYRIGDIIRIKYYVKTHLIKTHEDKHQS